MSQGLDMSGVRPRSRPPSLLACASCRKGHLKCDGRMPVCQRCEQKDAECNWTQSRRGYKGPHKSMRELQKPYCSHTYKASQGRHQIRGDALYCQPDIYSHGSRTTIDSQIAHVEGPDSTARREIGNAVYEQIVLQPLPNPLNMLSYQTTEADHSASTSPSNNSGFTSSVHTGLVSGGSQASTIDDIPDRLIEVFYTSFYPAHPFIIPYKMYLQNPGIFPVYLQNVLRFTACHYLPSTASEARSASALDISSESGKVDGYMVQAYLLLAMTLFARFEQEEGIKALNSALQICLQLNMNDRTFSEQNCRGDAVVAESWRRTWWDLYVVDGFVSAIDGLGWTSILREVKTDVPLPCGDTDYSNRRVISSTRTLSDMQDRAFDDEEYGWSSFAYEVEAMRIMHEVLRHNFRISTADKLSVEAIDASLSSFMLSLPKEKRILVERNGEVDEKLFSAHLIAQWATVLLHKSGSDLMLTQKQYPNACTFDDQIDTPVLASATHTSKAVRAADEIATLTSIRSRLTTHTPCFICGIAVSAIVHLPAFTLEANSRVRNQIKDRLRLAINALNIIGEVWPMAQMVKSQVSQYAREALMRSGNAPSSRVYFPLPKVDPNIWEDDSWVEILDSFVPIGLIGNQPISEEAPQLSVSAVPRF